MPESPDQLEGFEPPSKSELKRQQTAIQDLISELISLPKSQLDTLSAEGTSFDEIQVAAAMTPSSTRNRQIRYIAKLVFRDQDLLEKIRFLLETTEQAKRQGASQLHQVEYWREKILSGTSEDIFEFSSQFGGADQQQLRQLHRDFLKFSKIEKPSSKQQKAAETRQKEISRKTFKLIAETIRNSAGQ